MRTRIVALAAVLVLAAACTGGDGGSPGPSAAPAGEPWRGGTLRVATIGLDAAALDPKSFWYNGLDWSIHRCCLLRTLLSYTGRPTTEGGTELHPDLAAAMPEVSTDGLTWTFRLKEGLYYAPPFEDTGIVAQDVVRALERPAKRWDKPGNGYGSYYSVIRGFDDYWAGEADRISGLEVPNDHTLVVRLIEVTGDLGYRFALHATAPVPEDAADGHLADYGRYIVASGPYMIEGSDDLQPSLPRAEQEPVSGFVPGTWDPMTWGAGPGSLSLVRNPSWDEVTDDLRPAYPDRIEFTLVGDLDQWVPRTLERLSGRIESQALDVDLFTEDLDTLRRGHPPDRVFIEPTSTVFYIAMNLAAPPFDDIHVRKAVVLALDRASLERDLDDEGFLGAPIDHIAPDSVEGALLHTWVPEWFSDTSGDLQAARVEMRLSPYDADGDGRCDDPVCRDVRALVRTREGLMYSWPSVRDSLAEIGIRFHVARMDVQLQAYLLEHDDPYALIGLAGWIPDYPNGSTFFEPLLSGEGAWNLSMLGASPERLEASGYGPIEVPTVDERIDRCMELIDLEQIRCWADLDQYLMTDVVPWVPLQVSTFAAAVSSRVDHWSFDASTSWPSFDQISLEPGSE